MTLGLGQLSLYVPFAVACIAFVSAVVVASLTIADGRRRSELMRFREVLAEAYEACVQYREFPYKVRRRNGKDPEGERVRISEAMSDVQHRLSYFALMLRLEAPVVADRFDEMVKQTRTVAGVATHDAWNQQALSGPAGDSGMNIPEYGQSMAGLKAVDHAYRNAAEAELAVRSRLVRRSKRK